jgi:Arc/MetJ-type ribon-helix-helix transcriptional regulator
MYFMDVLTVRLDNNISKKIDVILKEFNYSTKTDFVREAIRTKVTEFEETRERKEILKNLEKNFGSIKTNKSIKENNILIKKAGEEFIREFEKKHNLK